MTATAAQPGGRRAYTIAAVMLAVVFLTINSDLLLGRAMIAYDGDDFFAPYFGLLADFTRSGRLLLWNPWTNGGMPDFVEPQMGAASPIYLLFGLLVGGTSQGYRWFHLATWLFSGMGMLFLGRRLGAPAWGSFVVALCFSFSGYQLGHAEHLSFLYSFAWLPAQILLLDRAIERRSPIAAAVAGVAWGLSFLGGYPPMTLNNGAFLALWTFGRWLFPVDGPRRAHGHDEDGRDAAGGADGPRTVRRAVALAGLLAVFVVVGLAVMSPVLIGMQVDAAGVSGRVAPLARARVIGENYLGPLALTTVFSPYFARLSPGVLWPHTDLSSCNVYAGAPVLTLALWALASRPRRLARWGMFGAGVLAVLLAVGQTLPFRGWLYDLVPPTRFFRHPAIYRGYAIASLSILALVGARELGRTTRHWRLLVCAVAGGAAVVAAFVKIGEMTFDSQLARGKVDAAVVWAGIIVIALGANLTRSRRRMLVLACGLVGLAGWDAFNAEALDVVHLTRNPATLAMWRALDSAHRSSLAMTAGLDRLPSATNAYGFGSGINDRNLLVKRSVLRGYVAFKNLLHERWCEHPVLVAAATGSERIWFAAAPVRAGVSDALFDGFVARAEALGAAPLVVHEPADMTRVGPTPVAAPAARTAAGATGDAAALAALRQSAPATRAPVRLLRYDPTLLELEADAPAAGWLLVTDRWAPGWKASVNGRPTPVFGGDFIFRAVQVQRGTNHVLMRYQPRTVPWLLVVCWGTMCAVAIATAMRRW